MGKWNEYVLLEALDDGVKRIVHLVRCVAEEVGKCWENNEGEVI